MSRHYWRKWRLYRIKTRAKVISGKVFTTWGKMTVQLEQKVKLFNLMPPPHLKNNQVYTSTKPSNSIPIKTYNTSFTYLKQTYSNLSSHRITSKSNPCTEIIFKQTKKKLHTQRYWITKQRRKRRTQDEKKESQTCFRK